MGNSPLWQILRSKQVCTSQTSEIFIPQSELDSIINTETVLEEGKLADIRNRLTDDTVHLILQSAKKIFAILVYIHRLHALPDFLENGVTDNSLPLRKASVIVPDFEAVRHKTEMLPFWHDIEARFIDCQWLFLSPVFSTPGDHLEIPSLCVLPFIHQEPVKIGDLGSALQCVRIHQSHQTIFKPHVMKLPSSPHHKTLS